MEKRAKDQVVNLRLRVREALRAQLEKAARRKGISLNAEVEARLERSFQDEAALAELPGLVKRTLAELSKGEQLAKTLLDLGIVAAAPRLGAKQAPSILDLEDEK
jgi:hypothetical protein